MKNIQTSVLKIIPLIVVALALFYFDASAQNGSQKLKKADSLFSAKQYTQSFELYKELFSNQIYSPAMLLKMAFIQEGLGHLSQSLYYLNLYSNYTHDSQAEDKIKELADKNSLEGYSDPYSQEKFLQLLNENRSKISLALVSVSIFLLAAIAFQRKKNEHRPIAAGIALVLILGLLFWQLNASDPNPSGIVEFTNTYLMEGPSSGSSVLAIVSEGHKLTIEGKYDVWFKVKWNGKDAFIKESSLLPLTLVN